jgi:hypothetical protein
MKSIQQQPGFAAVVMKLLTVTGLDATVHQIAAIHFKNFVKNNWRVRFSSFSLHLPFVPLPAPDLRCSSIYLLYGNLLPFCSQPRPAAT